MGAKLDVYLGPDALSKVRTERMYLKDALSLAEEYICVTYPMSALDASSAAPGILVGEAQRIFENLIQLLACDLHFSAPFADFVSFETIITHC